MGNSLRLVFSDVYSGVVPVLLGFFTDKEENGSPCIFAGKQNQQLNRNRETLSKMTVEDLYLENIDEYVKDENKIVRSIQMAFLNHEWF
jgi:hypothetical protein